MRHALTAAAFCLSTVPALAGPAKVTFDEAGTAYVDGDPFFPIGIFTYSLEPGVMAELEKKQCNTVIALTEHHKPEQLDFYREHGMMAIVPARDGWLAAAKDHPSTLAWYLTDEPEGHGNTPEGERERYLALKKDDPNHPVALCHFLFEALAKYKDACDVTMTDVYPITANRDVPITHVGLFMDQARTVHGSPGWPHWTYIQDFGGPETDGGKWAQPRPDEVRCMTYIALAHRANGILWFSYWPKAPETWEEVGKLNGEIRRMTPWLVAKGKELPAKSSDTTVQVRAKETGKGGILFVVNTKGEPVDVTVELPGAKTDSVQVLFGHGRVTLVKTGPRAIRVDKEGGTVHEDVDPPVAVLRDRLGPLEPRVYVWGKEPAVKTARPK